MPQLPNPLESETTNTGVELDEIVIQYNTKDYYIIIKF